jgi:hypothetical protein
MRFTLLSFAAVSSLLIASIAQAADPPPPGKPHSAPVRRFGPGSFNKQAAIGAYGRAVYPKYTWGFHSRDLQNIGVPHGDIGTLGSGLQRDPW